MAWIKVWVPDEDPGYHDQLWCVICEDMTKHFIKSSGHERDSSGDIYKCTICDNHQNPHYVQWSNPNEYD